MSANVLHMYLVLQGRELFLKFQNKCERKWVHLPPLLHSMESIEYNATCYQVVGNFNIILSSFGYQYRLMPICRSQVGVGIWLDVAKNIYCTLSGRRWREGNHNQKCINRAHP